MFDYAICEIGKRQYKVVPNTDLLLDFQEEGQKEIEANVLLLSVGGELKIGDPYLKDKLTLKVVEQVRGDKIRVSKFHAKANYRKVKGSRSKLTRVVYTVKTS